MRALPIPVAALCALVVGWTVRLTAQQGPCAQVTAACKNAGFTMGGASTGAGLQADCVIPIMQGIAQPAAAARPLPQVDPTVVAACKASHPSFGQGTVPAPTADIRRAPSSAAARLATPVSPSAIGSGVTSGPGITPPDSSLTAGTGSLKPGIPIGGRAAQIRPASGRGEGVKPTSKSVLMTCRIGQMNNACMACNTGPGASPAGVTFSHSTGPASSGLQPGECAFEDRAVRASEPYVLCFAASIQSMQFNGSVISGVFFNGPGTAILNHVANGPTEVMHFMVHQGASPFPCMIIDRYGP
jgi:hypothetical protein